MNKKAAKAQELRALMDHCAKIDADFEAYMQDNVAPEDQALFEANVMLALFEDPKRQDTFGWDALASRGAEIRAHNDEHGWRKMMEGVKT